MLGVVSQEYKHCLNWDQPNIKIILTWPISSIINWTPAVCSWYYSLYMKQNYNIIAEFQNWGTNNVRIVWQFLSDRYWWNSTCSQTAGISSIIYIRQTKNKGDQLKLRSKILLLYVLSIVQTNLYIAPSSCFWVTDLAAHTGDSFPT